MIRFKKFMEEKKIAHALDPNKTVKHAIKDRGVDWDNDGDVDALDRKHMLPDEITGTEQPDLTPTARKKNAAELKHIKKGVAYEEVEESTAAYGKSLEKEKEKRLTPNDRNKLSKIRAMLAKEKKPK